MAWSPQDLEAMLDALESARMRATSPAPQPLGVAPEYFMRELGPLGPNAEPQAGVPPDHPPPARSPSPGTPGPAPSRGVKQTPLASASGRTGADGLGEDFAAFSGKRPSSGGLPRGARNVKCNTVERDPDTGRITKIYTYDLVEEDLADGAELSGGFEEQSPRPD